MIVNGQYKGSGGRPTEKVKNLKRFAEQWAEFEDDRVYGEDDAGYVAGVLNMEGPGFGRFHEMANALEV